MNTTCNSNTWTKIVKRRKVRGICNDYQWNGCCYIDTKSILLECKVISLLGFQNSKTRSLISIVRKRHPIIWSELEDNVPDHTLTKEEYHVLEKLEELFFNAKN